MTPAQRTAIRSLATQGPVARRRAVQICVEAGMTDVQIASLTAIGVHNVRYTRRSIGMVKDRRPAGHGGSSSNVRSGCSCEDCSAARLARDRLKAERDAAATILTAINDHKDWTPEEDEFVLTCGLSRVQMARRLGRSAAAVRNRGTILRRLELGARIEKLVDRGIGVQKVAPMLGVTPAAAQRAWTFYRTQRRPDDKNHQRWTAEEDVELILGDATSRELAAKFGRTVDATKKRRAVLRARYNEAAGQEPSSQVA